MKRWRTSLKNGWEVVSRGARGELAAEATGWYCRYTKVLDRATDSGKTEGAWIEGGGSQEG